jgi:hypothetical protein
MNSKEWVTGYGAVVREKAPVIHPFLQQDVEKKGSH